MSVEHILAVYAEQTEQIAALLRQMSPSGTHKTCESGVQWFADGKIAAFFHPLSENSMKWYAEDYDVRVNHAVSFQYFSESAVNAPENILRVIQRVVSAWNCDLMFLPNGDHPVLIRRSGVLTAAAEFDSRFGRGAGEMLRTENRMQITPDMTMDEIMTRCEEKFGDRFNWFALPAEKRQEFFVPELKTELGADDSFFANPVYAVWKCEANDDLLFVSDGGGHALWRIYHLTYSHCREAEGFPRRWDFGSGFEAAQYIINQYIEENTYF